MALIHHDDEHPAVLEAREATRLPRWFWLAAVLVCIAVTLPACGGGADDSAPPAVAWQACTDTGWVSVGSTGSVAIGSHEALPASADGGVPARASGVLQLQLPAAAQAQAEVQAELRPAGGLSVAGTVVRISAAASAEGVATLPLAATLPAGTVARAPADLAIQINVAGAGGAIAGWRLQWCAEGVAP